MGDAPSWLQAGIDADVSSEAAGRSKDATANNRFWMPKGETRKIIFLSSGAGDDVATVFEHQLNIYKNWRNWHTCLEPAGVECPICKFNREHNQFKRYKGMFFSIIDTTEFTDKSGNSRKNLKKILCAKRGVAEIIKRKYLSRYENDETLRGAMFKVYRTPDDKSPSVGEDFEFIKMVDLAGFEDAEPHNWEEILRPDPEAVARAMAQVRSERGLDDDSPFDSDDASVEF